MRISEMIRTAFAVLLSVAVAAGLTFPAQAQAVPRGVSFTDVAASALQSNLQLRAAAFDVAVARAQLTQAQGGAGPQAGLSGSYARIQDHPPQDSNIYAAGLAISYPLSTGGNAEARIRLAEANLRGAVATYERTRQQIRYTAEQTYLQGLLAGENVAAAVRALTTANESLRVAQARFRAGTVARVDVLQAEVAVANAEQTLVQAQTSLATTQAVLNATLNLPLDTPLQPTDTLTPRPVEGTLSDALARAVRTRPDLVALQNQIGAAQAGIDLARSGGQPLVSLGAGYTVGNANGLSTFSYGGWSVSLAVTLSVFDGGITQGKISEAQLRLEQLQVREAQARQQVELDVRTAWLALERAAGELTAATKAVEQGRESLRLATARYQAGVGTSLELLSAQSALALAEQSLASARYDQNVARIQFILAIGAP